MDDKIKQLLIRVMGNYERAHDVLVSQGYDSLYEQDNVLVELALKEQANENTK